MTWRVDFENSSTGQVSSWLLYGDAVCIGRDPICDLVLPHGKVSRRHLLLTRHDGHCFLRDTSRHGVSLEVGDRWVSVHGEIGIVPPVALSVPGGILEVEFEQGELDGIEGESIWNQSVFLPGDAVVRRQEAILVCDLCGSSAIAFEDDRMAYHLKRRLRQLAAPLIQRYRSRFNKGTGDGFLATFRSVDDAFAVASRLAARIERRNAVTANARMNYRLALHWGETWEFDDGAADLHGNDVNIAFRIESVQAKAFSQLACQLPIQDRILCSGSFLSEMGSDQLVGAGYQPVDCGPAVLKGISEPIAIVWLKVSD